MANSDIWGIRSMPMKLLDNCYSLLVPRICLACSAELPQRQKEPLCNSCKTSLPFNSGHSCNCCGIPIDGAMGDAAEATCSSCRISPPPFLQTTFLLHYEKGSKELIRHMKFHQRPSLGIPLGQMLGSRIYAEMDIEAIDVVVPIPLHPIRLFQRKYNQSWIVAKQVATTVEKPLNHTALIRKEHRPPQAKLKRKERLQNLKKAFMVKDASELKGKSVLLIDDIMTTGATMIEATKTVKKAGATAVYCGVVARV